MEPAFASSIFSKPGFEANRPLRQYAVATGLSYRNSTAQFVAQQILALQNEN